MRIFLSLVLLAFAAQAQEKRIRRVPLEPTSMTSGQQMFQAYCAACHGPDGKGAGPAASALKKAPADLTRLQLDHNGKFPSAYLSATLKSDDGPAHKSKEMPVWGPLLNSVSQNQDETQLRIANLIVYIQSIQTK